MGSCATYQDLSTNNQKYQIVGLSLAGISFFLAFWVYFFLE